MKSKRRSLTPKERRAKIVEQRGLCACGCKEALNTYEGMIAEHIAVVALGNDQKPDAIYRKPCADRKTNGVRGDLNTIAHIKRIRDGRTQHDARKKRGPRLKSKAKLKGRGFDKSLTRTMDGKTVPRKKKRVRSARPNSP